MKKNFLFILLIFFSCPDSTAQEAFVLPSATFITKIPFVQLNGGIVVIRSTLDNLKDTLNFILDTGSGGISLDSATVDKLHLTKVNSDKTIRGIAGIKTVAFANNHSLNFTGLKVDSLNFHINNYDLLTSVYGVRIDGIIGYSFLSRYIVVINYDMQELEIYSPGMFKYPKGGYIMKPVFNSLVLSVFQVEDAKSIMSRFIFDTGAGLCFLFNEDFLDDSSFLKKKKKKFITQAEGFGGKKEMELTVIKSVKIGPYKFRKVPVFIFKDAYNITSYPQSCGLIGNDLLKRFNVILNYPEQTIYLKPNNKFSENFDYSYTGLGIYLIDNVIQVVDIIKHSPGDKAGFKNGDILIGIDNDFSNNIQSYKTALQNAGTRLKVFIIRNHQPMSLKLKVQNILRG
jgi:hypothetical protein